MATLNVPTARLLLPSTKDAPNEADRAWVEVRTALEVGDYLAASKFDNQAEQNLTILVQVITDWNFYTDNTETEKLPINLEQLNHFKMVDFDFLADWVAENLSTQEEGLDIEEKKASPASLAEAGTSSPTQTTQETSTNTSV